mgnify:CR=1 FL=1
MNYSKHIPRRPLSICDARYKPELLHSLQVALNVISSGNTRDRQPEKNEPARLAHGGFRSPLALPGDRFFW